MGCFDLKDLNLNKCQFEPLWKELLFTWPKWSFSIHNKLFRIIKNNTIFWEHLCSNWMQIAFMKLLEFWFLFWHKKSMFGCWRSFCLILYEKMILLHCRGCIETRFSRGSSQEFAGFMVSVICLVKTLWKLYVDT